jgi:BlaI family transcriptional regulator, penicillinase repressor
MTGQYRVSEAEWEVMKVLWSRAPQTANEISEELAPRMGWSPQTVKTLVGRLQRKGFLDYEKQGRAFLFTPSFEQEELLEDAATGFLERCFDGSLVGLLSLMVDQGNVSRKEMERLRKVLKEQVKTTGKKGRKKSR